jgi:hypothetical protein
MSAIADILQRLHAAARAPLDSELAVPVDPQDSLQGLAHALKQLESSSRTTTRPSASTLEEAKRVWSSSSRRLERLSARHIRALCWDPVSATDPVFTRALAYHPDLSKNRRWIEGLIESYIAQWRRMPDPSAFEEMLRGVIQQYSGRSERIETCRAVADRLFSPSAPTWLGEQVVASDASIESTLAEWRIELSSGLGEAIANAAVEAWTQRFNREREALRGATAYHWFRHLTQELLSCAAVTGAVAGRAVSAIILWCSSTHDERIKNELLDFLLKSPRYGDPRLPTLQNNWSLVETEAKQRVIGWMARGDLLFFFKFVITHDPHGRRDFWLKYIERAVDAHVALSDEDEWRLRAQVKERLTYSKVVGGQGTSAFIMRFNGRMDVICVEFSRTGNALFVHDTAAFVELNRSMRRPKFQLATQLKNASTMLNRFPHQGNWEWNVRHYLSAFGIRPG